MADPEIAPPAAHWSGQSWLAPAVALADAVLILVIVFIWLWR